MILNLKNNVTALKKGRKRTLKDSLGNFASMGNPLKSADAQGTIDNLKSQMQKLDDEDTRINNRHPEARVGGMSQWSQSRTRIYQKKKKLQDQINSIRGRL